MLQAPYPHLFSLHLDCFHVVPLLPFSHFFPLYSRYTPPHWHYSFDTPPTIHFPLFHFSFRCISLYTSNTFPLTSFRWHSHLPFFFLIYHSTVQFSIYLPIGSIMLTLQLPIPLFFHFFNCYSPCTISTPFLTPPFHTFSRYLAILKQYYVLPHFPTDSTEFSRCFSMNFTLLNFICDFHFLFSSSTCIIWVPPH